VSLEALKSLLEGVASCTDVHPLVKASLGDGDVERAAEIVRTLLRTWDDAPMVASSAMLPILE
jgi:hypothetical protein